MVFKKRDAPFFRDVELAAVSRVNRACMVWVEKMRDESRNVGSESAYTAYVLTMSIGEVDLCFVRSNYCHKTKTNEKEHVLTRCIGGIGINLARP